MGNKKNKNIDAGWLADQLRVVCTGAEPYDEGSGDGEHFIFYSDTGTCHLQRSAAPRLDNIINRILLSPAYGAYVTEKTIRDIVNEAIIALVNAGDKKKFYENKTAKEILSKIDGGIKKWEIVFPVEGLRFRYGRSFSFGKITIERYNKSRAKRHAHPRMRPIVMEGGSDAQDGYVEWGLTNAVVVFFAHEKSAYFIARMIVEEAFDILRVFLNIVPGKPDSIFFGVKGSRPAYNQVLSELCLSDGSVGVYSLQFGPTEDVQLADNLLRLVRKNKYFKLASKILSKEIKELNGFENRLITSARWLGRSYAELDVKMRFLCATICLESLLSQSGVQLTEHLALCVSKICEKDKYLRKKLYKTTKELYSLRSNLVHMGDDEIGSRDVGLVRQIARLVLLFAWDHWGKVKTDEQWKDVLIGVKTS